MAVVNTPILTAYTDKMFQYSFGTWHACLPVTMKTAQRIFIAFFICDYVLPLTTICCISVSIFRYITVHGITSTAGQNANRSAVI